MKDQFRSGTKKAAEQMSRLQQKLGEQSAHLRENLAALYWNRSPEQRQRIRLAAVAFAILSLGIVLGRLTDINRAVQIDKSDKTLKVEKSGTLELKLPGVTLNPEIYVFKEAKTSEVPIEIKVPGRLAFNAEKSKVISARVAGRVERIFAFDGAAVNVGSPILEMYSPEFNSAQQEYLLASKTASILGKNQAMGDLLQDAKMTQDAASNRLRNIGVSDQEIAQLGSNQRTQSNLLIRSPIQGVVIKRNTEPGAFVNSGDVLASLADPKALWFLGNVFEKDIRLLSSGQQLILKTEAYPDREFIAQTNYVAPSVDPETRALLIRADVNNDDGLLRPDMFMSAKLLVGKGLAVVVPQSAIVRIREMRYAIVQVAPDTFRRLPVKGYDLDGKRFAITDGLGAGLMVLTDGAVLLNDRFAKLED
ncbi:efflux RND transporter periplasmic adaptor subunit [Polynucleobacter difficilis]|uniref:efflux RND transporter periplasmic adaptor subunit n=1 Tax=Polynucleobacter difficilis TaxID=556054 RepID=UPI001901C3C2|nr:efflux RND transporter periplasmic adaptor subunit [Polynucleobacter difficilis]